VARGNDSAASYARAERSERSHSAPALGAWWRLVLPPQTEGNDMHFELINLNSTKKPPRIFERMAEALGSAEQRGLSRYRIDELGRDGTRVLRLQIGSTA
jgi:hypothetical protein